MEAKVHDLKLQVKEEIVRNHALEAVPIIYVKI